MRKIINRAKIIYCEGPRLYLRSVKISDATKQYVTWLNSMTVNRFLESRFVKYDIKNLKEYITTTSNKPNVVFLAIILKKNEKHIGNIKIDIDWHHNLGTVGIMIGDTDSWGQGYGSEAIEIISKFAFKRLRLHKLISYIYANNTGSIMAFLKAGFFQEAVLKKHILYDGQYIDRLLLCKFDK